MARDLSSRLRRLARILLVSLLPSLALGYAIFYVLFPLATFPVSSDASFGWILFVLIAAAILAGFVAEDLPAALTAGFFGVVLGILVGVLLTLSPAFAGFYFLAPGDVPVFVIHYGVLVVAAAFPVNMVATIIGQALRGWLLPPEVSYRFAP